MSTTGQAIRAEYGVRHAVILTVFTLLFLTLMGRFFYLQIVRGEDYRERARTSFIKRRDIPARRGLIKDRNGVLIAGNVPTYRLAVTPALLGDDRGEKVFEELRRMLPMTDEEMSKARDEVAEAIEEQRSWEHVTVRQELVAETCPYDGARLELMDKPSRELLCRRCGLTHEPIDAKARRCPHDHSKLRWDPGEKLHAVCTKCGRSYVTTAICPHDGALMDVVEHNLQCPVCQRHFSNEVAMLNAVLYKLPGVSVQTGFRRDYPLRYTASHLVGYMNRVTAEERKRNPGVYGLTDRVGRRGIEWALEKVLRGRKGEALYLRGAKARQLNPAQVRRLINEDEFKRAVAGYDVWLTIDMRLQEEVKKAFRYYKSGAAVVIDPRDGAVLAMYSKPGFDPNIWSGRLSPEIWEETQENPYSPLLNKAATAYAPGSVYKIVTAIAGLAEGVITPEMTINCPGHYDFGGRRFHCHYRAGHGPLSLVDAIKHSCDVYFYRVGEMLGMDTLARYGLLFGFGQKTGIEGGERAGRVPTKHWHETQTRLKWQPGFTLSTAIGQGALTATPLQVARAYATLVNGGRLLQLRLVDQYRDERGDVVRRFGPEIVEILDLDPYQVSLVREGLVRVVNDKNGTAGNLALDSIVMGGKTGTAEAAEHRPGVSPELSRWLKEDHAWFAAYAPAEDPQIVVVVFVEHGGSGARMAGPIARKIVSAWLQLGSREAHADTSDEGAATDEGGSP